MKNIYKFLILAAVIVSVIALFSNDVKLGGDTNFDSLDVTDGYKVDGLTVIDGNGNIDRLVQGGDITTLATSPAETLTAAQVCNSRVVVHDPDYATYSTSTGSAVTLPDAGDLFSDCLTANGDSVSLWFVNPDAATASSTTITAGASTTLVGYNADQDQINGGNKAFLELVRRSDTELIVSVIELINAD